MTKPILVPLDGSPFGAHALPLAASLARRFGAELDLVHVHERPVQLLGAPPNDLQFDVEMEQLMSREHRDSAERLSQETRLRVRATVLEGPVEATLLQHIAASQPLLVVMSSHGRGGVRRVVAGNVADALARYSGVPLLIERDADDGSTALAAKDAFFRSILLPLDGSPLADEIIDYAVRLGEPGRTTFTLLRVVVPISVVATPAPAPPMPADGIEIERLRREALADFGRIAYALKKQGFTAVPHVVVHSQPAAAILAFVAEHPTDLIAMSTHGHGGFARAVLGSVADKVMRRADVAFLLHAPQEVPIGQSSGAPSATAGVQA